MFDLTPYSAKNFNTLTKSCILVNVPIGHLSDVKLMLKAFGHTKTHRYTFRYRGPRKTAVGDTRSNYSKQSTCLKRFAKTFSVYIYEKE